MSEPVWVPIGAVQVIPWQIVFTALANEPPGVSFATLDVRNVHPVLDFDAAAAEYAIFRGVMPAAYGNRGLNIKLLWAATTAVTGNVFWIAYLERLTGQDIDADGWATAFGGPVACPATSGVLAASTYSCPHGATYMDDIVGGDAFRLRVARLAADAGDTMAGDAELLAVVITEQ